MSTLSQIAHLARRLVHVLARPARHAAERGGLVVQPYRGYGTADEVYLMGRVFRQPSLGGGRLDAPLLRDLRALLQRFLRWGVADTDVRLRLGGAATTATTDAHGFFHARFQPGTLDRARTWHPVEIEVPTPEGPLQTRGEVLVPPPSSRFVVISDIDDTVVFTGVANVVGMLWRLFVQGAESRVAFPGVGALYRAFHAGAGVDERNPMLYVSRGPWSIYEVLEAFYDLHRIPVGPVLFLRYWGLTLQHPLPRRSQGHKRDLIETMLALYDDRPFVLIGDSGQHDPETYADVVRRHPGRVKAIYIRNVSEDAARDAAIEELAAEVAEAGSPLVLAADSFAMAAHAAEHGLISPEALEAVLRERTRQRGAPDLQPTVSVAPADAEAAAEADATERAPHPDSADAGRPPNVQVDPGRD